MSRKRRNLMKIFGPLWSEVEGKFLGLGRKRKFRVEWTSFHPHVIGEYGAQYLIFIDDQDTLVLQILYLGTRQIITNQFCNYNALDLLTKRS